MEFYPIITKWKYSCSDCLWSYGLYCTWNSLVRNTGVGSRSLLQGIFPNPGIERKSPTLQADSLPAGPPGKPKNTGVSSCFLLQAIFPTRESNPGLLHCRWILYQLSHQGSLRILEWVAYPFSSRSSQPRNRTGVSCIAGGFFTSWATREAQLSQMMILIYTDQYFDDMLLNVKGSFQNIYFFYGPTLKIYWFYLYTLKLN